MRTRGRKHAEENATAAAGSDDYSNPFAKSSSFSAPDSPTIAWHRKVKSPSHPRAARPQSSSASSSSPAKPSAPPPLPPPSKIPWPLQFPLVVVLNIALSALGSALAYPYTKAVVAAHERPLETWDEAAIVIGWRILELALGWLGDYDSYDLTAMSLLSHGPPLYLLFAFYKVPAPALLLSLAIETLSTYLPFRLLRPLAAVHAAPASAPNAEIVADRPIALLTTLLAGAIYSVTLFLAYATYLPAYMAAHFRGLPSLAAAHPETGTWVNGMLPASLALGFAARAFVFTPSEAARVDEQRRREVEAFDPATASLRQTLRWNVWWGWSDQARAVVRRTTLLTVVTGANAFIHARFAVRGVETPGAAAWAAVWVVAAALTGFALGIVGSV